MTAPPSLSEDAFQRRILEYCQYRGLKVWHDNDSRRNDRGWPDLVIAGPERVLFRELKTDTGAVRPEQKAWLEALQAGGLDACVWRPKDWSNYVLPQLAALTARNHLRGST